MYPINQLVTVKPLISGNVISGTFDNQVLGKMVSNKKMLPVV